MKYRVVLPLIACLLTALLWPAVAMAQSSEPPHPMMHIVERGETVFSIARRYGTTVEAITHANGISDPHHVYAGQQIVIPSSLGPVDSWSAHVVQPGETFSAIAAGGQHTCGLTTGGVVHCWGSNLRGQAGVGTTGIPSKKLRAKQPYWCLGPSS